MERALELTAEATLLGLGSGRAAQAFVRALGAQLKAGQRPALKATATSEETAALAAELNIPLVPLAEAGTLDFTVDGADEVDPQLNLIKGWGRALVREKIVAASSRRLIILVGEEKLVPRLGSRGKLPVEIIPFAQPLCERRLAALGLRPVLWQKNGRPGTTDNGNYILDCGLEPIADPAMLEADLRTIPGVVGTGLFLSMADTVLVGTTEGFQLMEERKGDRSIRNAAGTSSVTS